MKKEDLTIFEYRKSKEIVNYDYILNEKMTGKFDKITVRTQTSGYVDCYIYRPSYYNGEELLNVVFNFHGGGMVLGYPEQDGIYCQKIADEANVAVINVDYCLAPEFKFPKPIYSTYEAIVEIVKNQNQLHLNMESIILMGHSAGGYLATALSILNKEENRLNIVGLIQNYAIYKQISDPTLRQVKDPSKAISPTRMKQYLNWYFDDLSKINTPLASPLCADLKNMPYTLMIVAEYDSLSQEAFEYYKKVLECQGKIEYHLFKECQHGFTHQWFNEYNEEKSEKAWKLISEFIIKRKKENENE